MRSPAAFDDAQLLAQEPFAIFEIPDFLDEERYEELRSTYPSSEAVDYLTHKVGAKQYLDNRHEAFGSVLERSPAWRSTYDHFADQGTVDQLFELSRPHARHRPARETMPWLLVPPPVPGTKSASPTRRRAVRAMHLARRRTPVYLGFELSILHTGDSIPPHTDVPEKLVSMLLYFPEPGEPCDGLGTEFYRARPGCTPWTAWQSDMPDDEVTAEFRADHEVFVQPDFVGRHLFGFVKTGVSWHGLPPITAGPTGRRAVIINYFRY